MQGMRHAAVACYRNYLITQQIRKTRQARRVSNCDNLVWIPICRVDDGVQCFI